MRRIAIGGSAANPPHLGHRTLIEGLLKSGSFDQVVWIPSGDRADKAYQVSPDDRVIMTLLTFPVGWYLGKPDFRIRFTDVYHSNTPTIEVIEEFERLFPEDQIIWFTGADSVVPLEKLGGKCDLETWDRGADLMRKRFCILPRPGYQDPRFLSLPEQFEVLDVAQRGIDSSQVRELVRQGLGFENLVTHEVAQYIKQNKLYGYGGE